MDSLRLSDADREKAVELLSEHYSLGRLTKDEFDERSDAVWSAKAQGDLAPVFADLPPTPQQGRRGRLPAGAPHRPRWWPVSPRGSTRSATSSAVGCSSCDQVFGPHLQFRRQRIKRSRVQPSAVPPAPL